MNCMLANKYEDSMDPTGWWMSEKYDGIRAIWTGEEFVTRTNKVLQAPAWFKAGMPTGYGLDGELWAGRGNFQQAVGIVRSHEGNSDWKSITYMVFDVLTGSDDDRFDSWRNTFEKRQEYLNMIKLPDHCEVADQVLIENREHFNIAKMCIIAEGGEGLMLRAPNSKYVIGRSLNLLKVKNHKYGTAVIEGFVYGTGKFDGMMGSLLCKWKNKNISIGSGFSEEDRKQEWSQGTEVEFKYYDVTEGGFPRFPIFIKRN